MARRTDRRPGRDMLLVMTRLPEPGRSKTRLIPALGAAGAAEMHDRLARHAIGRASSWALTRPRGRLRVLLAGGTGLDGREWLGGDFDCRVQAAGDLGERLRIAFAEAFEDGAERVVVIGTDCPELDEEELDRAFDALGDHDVTFGPAEDGGYYLAGLSRPCPALFRDIEWGGPRVLRQSLAAAKAAGASVRLLDELRDVDTSEDLANAEAALAEGARVSVIIPVVNEAERIGELLRRIREDAPGEILVVDGRSGDDTRSIANEAGARLIDSPRGRGVQMNAGAAAASGEFLLFLHADTLPPTGYPAVVARLLRRPGVSAGAFAFRLDDDLPAAPLIEAAVSLRCRLRRRPYGDQGLFVRRRLFHAIGGFREWPVMEDLDMIDRLRRLGRIEISGRAARTSARRWRRDGVLATTLRHQAMLAAHRLGVPPRILARWRT